jgi:hypothetical protein
MDFDVVMKAHDGQLWLLTESTVRPDMPSITIPEMRVLHRCGGVMPPGMVSAVLDVKRILGGSIVEAIKHG